MVRRDVMGTAGLLGELALAMGLLAGCAQRPYPAFAVELNANEPPAAATVAPAAPARGAAAGMQAKHPQWDLNRAPAATLERLPGIDGATVAAIVAGRPYKGKRELLRRRIVTAAQYAQWKEYFVVHRG